MADSEADIYELLQESQEESKQLDWIIRACHDRALRVDNANTSHHLRQTVLKESVMYTDTISVRGRKLKVKCDKRGRRQLAQAQAARPDIPKGPPSEAGGPPPGVGGPPPGGGRRGSAVRKVRSDER